MVTDLHPKEKKLHFKANGVEYKVTGTQRYPYMIRVKNCKSGKSKLMDPKTVNKYLPIIWDGETNNLP